jgi:hypothetical protein
VLPENFNWTAGHSHDSDPPLTMRAPCHFVFLVECLDIAERSLQRRCRGGFTTSGETAACRQILPGRLRVVNHKKAKVS